MIQQMYRAKNKKKKLKIQKGSQLSLFKLVFIQKKTKKLQLYSVNIETKWQAKVKQKIKDIEKGKSVDKMKLGT